MPRNRKTEKGRQAQNADASAYRARRRSAREAARAAGIAAEDAARPAPADVAPGGCEVCGSPAGGAVEGCDGCGREFGACCRAFPGQCRECAGKGRQKPVEASQASPAPSPLRWKLATAPRGLTRREAALWRQSARDHDLRKWSFVRRRLLAQWCRHEATAVELSDRIAAGETDLLVARARETARAGLILRQLKL